MKEHILGEIRRLAVANDGQPPGKKTFFRETGIAEHQWSGRIWARWSDALAEAGLEPNKIQHRFDSDEMLGKIGEACRHYGHLPTVAEFNLYKRRSPGFPSTKAITSHFGSRDGLIAALTKYVEGDADKADILERLPRVALTPAMPQPRHAEGFVYLIKSGEFYKIGRGDDLERRVKQITVALPDKATLVHSIRTDDPAGIEAYWHRRFAEKRANGEWFKLSSLDVSAFRKRKIPIATGACRQTKERAGGSLRRPFLSDYSAAYSAATASGSGAFATPPARFLSTYGITPPALK